MTSPVAAFAGAARGQGQAAVEAGAVVVGAYATAQHQTDAAVNEVMVATSEQLDRLAEPVNASSSHDLMLALFGTGEFAGNIGGYYDPENSLLPALFTHRRGNPITLSVLAIAIGRRLGIALQGVSMPGHFLLTSDDAPNLWFDPFHGGAVLDSEGVLAFFRHLHGESAHLDPMQLAPVGPAPILMRMLNNLRMIYGRTGSMEDLAWLGRLSATLPGAGEEWALSIADALESDRRFGQAALIYEAASEFGSDIQRDMYDAEAKRLRGR